MRELENSVAKKLPRPVVRRLIQYLRLARESKARGTEWMSSKEMATQLGLTSSTVRQDLSYLNFSGVPRNGYATEELEDTLTTLLKADKVNDVILVGAGNLGRAIAQHNGFERNGYLIRAIYDRSTDVVGQTFGEHVVRDITRARTEIPANEWRLAILAVPQRTAQEVADYLYKAGIRGYLNLSLAHISLPKDAQIVDTRLMDNLQELVFSIMD